MKYLLTIAAATLLLCSCSTHSSADKEQLREAHQQASEMLQNIQHTDSVK